MPSFGVYRGSDGHDGLLDYWDVCLGSVLLCSLSLRASVRLGIYIGTVVCYHSKGWPKKRLACVLVHRGNLIKLGAPLCKVAVS